MNISTGCPRRSRHSVWRYSLLLLLLGITHFAQGQNQRNWTRGTTQDNITEYSYIMGVADQDATISNLDPSLPLPETDTYLLKSGIEQTSTLLKVPYPSVRNNELLLTMKLQLRLLAENGIPVEKLAVAPLMEAWDEFTVSEDTRPQVDYSATAYAYERNGVVEFDLTGMAGLWADRPEQYHGLILWADYSQEGAITLASDDANQAVNRPEFFASAIKLTGNNPGPAEEIDITTFQQQEVFGQLDFTNVQGEIPQILMEKSLIGFDMDAADGEGNDETTAETWFSIYQSLYGGRIEDAFPNMQDVDALSTSLMETGLMNDEDPTNDIHPLLIIDHSYHHLDPRSIQDNLIEIVGRTFYDVIGRERSPYLPNRAFAFSSYLDQIKLNSANQATMIIPTEGIISDRSTGTLQINVGNGWQSITPGVPFTVTLPRDSEVDISLQNTLDGKKVTTTVLTVGVSPGAGEYGVAKSDTQWTITLGNDVVAYLTIRSNESCWGSSEGDAWKLDRPFILVEGFNPQLNLSADSYFEKLMVLRDGTGDNDDYLMSQLEDLGYDMMVLNFVGKYNWRKIQDNAAVLQRILVELNQTNGPNASNQVMGFSMGGLIARYALTKMEAEPGNFLTKHQVANYFSYDSPHQGAYFPLGLLQLFKGIINDLKLPWNGERPLEGAPIIGTLNSAYQSPASSQMSVVSALHPDDPNAERPRIQDMIHPFREEFYTELEALGFPLESNNYGISNGALPPQLQEGRWLGGDLNPGDQLLHIDINGFDLLRLKASVYALPEHRNTGTTCRYTWYTGVLNYIFDDLVLPDIPLKFARYETDGNLYPYEGMPGGYVDALDQITFDFPNPWANSRKPRTCFVPTVSALAMNDQQFRASSYWQSKHMLNAYGSVEAMAGPSAFDDVITDEGNHEHIEGVSIAFADFIMDALKLNELTTSPRTVDVTWANMPEVNQESIWYYPLGEIIDGPTDVSNAVEGFAQDLWNLAAPDVYEFIEADPEMDNMVYYLKYNAMTDNLLFGNLCKVNDESLLYGFYHDQQIIRHVPEKEIFAQAIDSLAFYHGLRGAPKPLPLTFTSGATISSTPDKTTTIIGRYHPDTKIALEAFGNFGNRNFRGKPNGFNMLNVTQAQADVIGDGLPVNAIGQAFWTQLNGPWIGEVLDRGDIVYAVSDRYETDQFYDPEKNPTYQGRNPDEMTIFGREVDSLEQRGWRYRADQQIAPLPSGHHCDCDPPYHKMDFSIPAWGNNSRHQNRAQIGADQVGELMDQLNACDLGGLGQFGMLRAQISLKDRQKNLEYALMSMDVQNDDAVASNCNGFTYVKSGDVNYSEFTVRQDPGTSLNTRYTAEAKMLVMLDDLIRRDFSANGIDYCGEIYILSQGLNDKGTQNIINQFREKHPEIRVREFDGPMSLFPPAGPTNLRANNVQPEYVELEWDDNATNETGFYLYRRNNSSEPWGSPIANIGANVTQYPATGLTPERSYQFMVRAYNNAGLSVDSNVLPIYTPDGIPNAPLNLTRTAEGEFSVSVEWQWANPQRYPIDYFELRVRSVNAANWEYIAQFDGTLRAGTIGGLEDCEAFVMEMVAVNKYGESVPSNRIDARTRANGLFSPTNLDATQITSSSTRLQWTDVATSEDKYIVYGKKDTDAGWTIVKTLNGPNHTADLITGLEPGTRYIFQVEAWQNFCRSGLSTPENFTTICPSPVTPTVSSTTVTTTRVSWPAQTGIGTYLVQYKKSASAIWADSKTVTGTETTLSSLSEGTAYDVRVSAYCPNAQIYSAFTQPVSFETRCANPYGLELNYVYTTTANFDWTGTAGADRYEIILTNTETNSVQRITSLGTGTSYTLTGLTPGTQYRIAVRGWCTAYSDWTQPTFPVALNTPCTPPTGMSASNETETNVDLQWGPSTGADNYQVHYRYTNQLNWNTKLTNSSATSYTLTGLQQGQDYEVKVRAYCPSVSDYTGFTPTANFTTVCPVPSITSISKTNVTATINWSGPFNPGQYRVYYRTDHEIDWTTVVATGVSGSYSLTDLNPETNYEVAIETYCPGSNAWSGISEIDYFRTNPPIPYAPTNLTLVSQTETSLTVRWEDQSYNEAGFFIQARPVQGGFDWSYRQRLVGQDVEQVTINNLQAGTMYEVRVRAYNITGYSTPANILRTGTDCGSVSAFNVTANTDQYNSVSTSWTPANGISSYQVGWYRPYQDTVWGSWTTNTYYTVNQNLSPNSVYNMVLRGICNGQIIPLAGPRVAFTCSQPPFNLSANRVPLVNNAIALSWSYIDRDFLFEDDEFEIVWCESSNYPGSCLSRTTRAIELVAVDLLGFEYSTEIVGGLKSGTNYSARIRATSRCDDGWTGWSELIPFSTRCGKPTGLRTANTYYNRTDVFWDGQERATEWEVRYKVEGWLNSYGDPIPATQDSKRLTGLEPSTNYVYQVRARCAEGWTDWSTADKFRTGDLCAIPSSLSYTTNGTTATLLWGDVVGSSRYTVYYKNTSSSTWSVANTTNSYYQIPVSYCETYQYKVRSVCNSGYITEFSNTITVNPGCPPPSRPTNLRTYYSNGTIYLYWDPPTSGGPVNYYYIYQDGQYKGYTNAGDHNYVLSHDCGYVNFRVKAVGPGGGTDSYTLYKEYDICAPYLYSSAINGNVVTLKWNDNSDNEQYFIIYDQNNRVVTTASPGATSKSFTQDCYTYNRYRVAAYSSSGGNRSSSYSYSLYAGCPPTTPTNVKVTYLSGAGQFRISWSDSKGETGYYVYLDNTYLGYTGANQTYLDIPGYKFTCGRSGSFRVQAVHSTYGGSAFGSTYYSRSKPATPVVSANVTGSRTQTVSWQYQYGVSKYIVQKSLDQYIWTDYREVTGLSTTFYNLPIMDWYYYRVQAESSTGCRSPFGYAQAYQMYRDGAEATNYATSGENEVSFPEGQYLSIYPNPMVTGEATLAIRDLQGEGSLTVFDLMGREVIRKSLNLTGVIEEVALDLREEPSGIYVIQVELNGKVYRLRVTR